MDLLADTESHKMQHTPSVREVEDFHGCTLGYTYNPLDTKSLEAHRRMTELLERDLPNFATEVVTAQIVDQDGNHTFGVFYPRS